MKWVAHCYGYVLIGNIGSLELARLWGDEFESLNLVNECSYFLVPSVAYNFDELADIVLSGLMHNIQCPAPCASHNLSSYPI